MLSALLLAFSIFTAPVPQDVDRPRITALELERRILDLINGERARSRIKALQPDAKLTDLARAHSADMGERRFFDHVNPDGDGPSERARAAGYACNRHVGNMIRIGLAENIFQHNLYDRILFVGERTLYEWNTMEEIAVTTVHYWINSSGHRRNIVDRDYQNTGIGVAIAPNDKILITQLFC